MNALAHRGVRRRRAATLLAVLLSAPLTAHPPPTEQDARVREAWGRTAQLPTTLHVGQLTLTRCAGDPAYCGTVARPLDPAGRWPDRLAIHVEVFAHRDHSQPPLEPILAQEGGPGFSSAGTAQGYFVLFEPLLARHDLILIDQRGAGASAPINCPGLQAEVYATAAAIRACAQRLGPRAYLYATALAADDTAAVLDALGVARVDLYGDSYGTFLAQVFAARHGERLRALVLDSAYSVRQPSAWGPELGPAARQALRLACERSAPCARLGGDPIARLERLLTVVRRRPIHTRVADTHGQWQQVRIDGPSLAYLVFSNETTALVYRELDAAVRDYFETGEVLPLARLIERNRTVSASGPVSDPSNYSAGQFLAISCADYPQLYDMSAPPAQRAAQRRAAFARAARVSPDLYAPFSIAEFAAMPLETSTLDLCLPWARAESTVTPPGRPTDGRAFPAVPTLVLSADLDSLTPAAQGEAAAGLFPNARYVLVSNSFHVTAEGDRDACASQIVERFIGDLDPGDTGCTRRVAEVHLLPRFARRAAELAPAMAEAGNQGSDGELRSVAAAAYAIGDVIAQWWVCPGSEGVGLRAGHFTFGADGERTRFSLQAVRWVEDLAVSGTVSWQYGFPGAVEAHVQVQGAAQGELTVSWHEREPMAQASIRGVLNGHAIAARMYAP